MKWRHEYIESENIQVVGNPNKVFKENVNYSYIQNAHVLYMFKAIVSPGRMA
jgi:hypothetical protein